MENAPPDEESLLSEALALSDADARQAFVWRACGGNDRLLTRITSLLRAHESAGAFLEAKRPRPFDVSPLETFGGQIGPYKLLSVIGEGGCGIVFEAEQSLPIRRRVALKVIKAGMDSRAVVTRFEAERQALAVMDHPNVARIYDAGQTSTGRPYFVMELISGAPISKFCAQKNLLLQARISLFLAVCHAVEHAHQKGLIHRDLKPSNILVAKSEPPAPKIIDFGVARAIQPGIGENAVFTELSQFIGTPAYMSPEQARMSRDIDTRADIYSLGVILYELLAGKTPFDNHELLTNGVDGMRQIITERTPARPSIGLPGFPEDLDWVILKCLEKDRARRYESVGALAADLERCLAREPVIARPPSRLYRAQRWVERNRLLFATVFCAAILLTCATSFSVWQALRATRAEEISAAEASRALLVKNFLIDQILESSPYLNPHAANARKALIESIAESAARRFANEPIIEAEIRMAAGAAFFHLSEGAKGLAQFERALELRASALGPRHSETYWARAWVADARHSMGDKAKAREILDAAIAEIRSAPHPLSSGEAEVIFLKGAWLQQADRAQEGLQLMEEALPISRQAMGPSDYRLRNKVWWVGAALTDLQRWDDAERFWNDETRLCEQLFGPEHPLTLQAEKGKAFLFLSQHRSAEAAVILERIVPLYERALGPDHHNSRDASQLLVRARAALERK